MHVLFTVGTILAAYGGSRDTSMPGGVKNDALSKAGNIMMFLIMLGALVWLYPAGKHTFFARQDVNFPAAEALLMGAAPGMVLQLIRMNYDLIYAFTLIPSLHPTTGSFAIRLFNPSAARLNYFKFQTKSDKTHALETPLKAPVPNTRLG
ncbi:hypothetical protein HG530_012522 [Fusarium avenaceum]|nr:hypothetical protein HG530_012522 [Fusarium avenaceum]